MDIREPVQLISVMKFTNRITKYGVTVRKREDLGRIIKEAFYIARSGRPGPVLVDLPKDVMAELGSPNYPETVNIRGYKPSTGVHIGQLKRAVKMLGKAKKPLFLAGGGVNIAGANKAFTELVERTQIPVVTTIMGRGAICCSRSGPDLTIVSPENCMHLHRRLRSYISTLILPPSHVTFR